MHGAQFAGAVPIMPRRFYEETRARRR